MTVLTGRPNGIQGFVVPNNAELVTADKTLTQADAGKTFYSTVDVVYTLPALFNGGLYRFVNLADDGIAQVTVSPNASDGIAWAGSITDDKDAINTKATAKRGDTFAVIRTGAASWTVTEAVGVWDKEA